MDRPNDSDDRRAAQQWEAYAAYERLYWRRHGLAPGHPDYAPLSLALRQAAAHRYSLMAAPSQAGSAEARDAAAT